MAGVAAEDREIWNLIKAVAAAEIRHFGRTYSGEGRELKAKKLLNRKVFRLAAQMPEIPDEERASLARKCLDSGATAKKVEMTALAQAKIAYVAEVLDICARFRCKVVVSAVAAGAPRPAPDHLRKDYAYLFERFFYFLEDVGPAAFGIIVFDELEKSQCHLLLGQMDRYFKRTSRGRHRCGQILPQPLFVHSDLTTGIQIADLVAYLICWGARFGSSRTAARPELEPLIRRVMSLRHRSTRQIDGNPAFRVWSLVWIRDLRPRTERLDSGRS